MPAGCCAGLQGQNAAGDCPQPLFSRATNSVSQADVSVQGNTYTAPQRGASEMREVGKYSKTCCPRNCPPLSPPGSLLLTLPSTVCIPLYVLLHGFQGSAKTSASLALSGSLVIQVKPSSESLVLLRLAVSLSLSIQIIKAIVAFAAK